VITPSAALLISSLELAAIGALIFITRLLWRESVSRSQNVRYIAAIIGVVGFMWMIVQIARLMAKP